VRDLDGGIQTQSASSALLCWHCGRQKTDLEAAAYLSDLRNNRVARPSGARPQPSRSRRDSKDTTVIVQADLPESTSGDAIPRSASILSHKRAQSALSTYSSVTSRTGRQLAQPPVSGASVSPLKASDVVPSATYIERGQRWMEKEEAVSLREAMEDMDLKKEEEEARIHAAAQDEASELVYQHQNPGSVPAPDAPYRYNDHLRKNSYQHARTQSVGRYSGIGMVTGLARDITPRSASGGSSSSGGMPSPPIRVTRLVNGCEAKSKVLRQYVKCHWKLKEEEQCQEECERRDRGHFYGRTNMGGARTGGVRSRAFYRHTRYPSTLAHQAS